MTNPPNKYQVLISVDIGLHGGISFFDVETKEVLSIYDMPSERVTTSSGREKGQIDLPKLNFILEIPKCHGESAIVVFENIHAFPGQGAVATATLMEQRGIVRGMCRGLGYDEDSVEPKAWQKRYDMIPPKGLRGASASKTKSLRKKWLKEKSLEIARGVFPEWSLTKLGTKDAHGLSDSLLIGRYYLEERMSGTG